MSISLVEHFPVGKDNIVKGTRRLVREKVLQILIAKSVCEENLDTLFDYIFFRVYNFGDLEEQPTKLLRPAEVVELEADYGIEWKNEEIEFGKKLINCVLVQKDYVDTLLRTTSSNWEIDRIAKIDSTLIHIAVAEFTSFPEIPMKVSINEALEISKMYSTDKSSVFINGVLDTMKSELQKLGKINKEGRGLIAS